MEGIKKTLHLFLLLALPLHSSQLSGCPTLPIEGLTCYNDYSKVITCSWNSTFASDHQDTECRIDAKRVTPGVDYRYGSSCKLEPVDVSTPTLRKCSMVFGKKDMFMSFDELSINLTCHPVEKSLDFLYWPICHIKLDPPPKLFIDNATFSWSPQLIKRRFRDYRCELQWKEADKSWSDPSVKTIPQSCKWTCSDLKLCNCTTDMREPEQVMRGARYQARVRVRSNDDAKYLSTWSEWSETTSWVSTFGRAKPTAPPSDVVRCVFGALGSLAAVALLLVLFKTDKSSWVYMLKKRITVQIPKPQNSFLKDLNSKSWSGPYFDIEIMDSFLKPVDIVSVEVSSAVDAVLPNSPEAALQEKMRVESSYESTSSSFSNPSYSQLSPPLAHVSLLTAGNLKPCNADSPYGPVSSQGEGRKAEEDKDDESREEVRKLLSEGNSNKEPMPVISDYEKVEKPQMERFRLQSLDSGVCSGEEVSQESLEVDSINVSDEDPEGKEEETQGEDRKEVDFQKLLKGIGGVFDKGSIQVCSGYEQVQRPQGDSPELNSLDSVISSGDEEQASQEESLEDAVQPAESTSLLFSPPLHSSALACALPSFTPLPLNFSAAALSPDLGPLPIQMLGRMALLSTSGPVEPSGDGYMPVRQEQN
ncbi:uncharacterized protein LOC115586004 isoform X2 [Sparus aurata]|uniref:Interleukin-2 receptor subunit beta N-terminal domain-containing protein n=1 Tax=Sparus aurata TaxID=8175 RepID=A0A671W5U3_SPAAU|nr:cytokine receptor common subunit beta isoform X2 [Sparus aurata]